MKNSFPFFLQFFLLFICITVNAQVVEYYYPLNVLYGTGYIDSTGKHDGDIVLANSNVGWAVFDISSIPTGSVIQSVSFYLYFNNSYWYYWSGTPMGTVDPIMDPPADIFTQIMSSYDQGIAYIFIDEFSTISPGWQEFGMENDAIPDLQAAVNSSQGWFAMGFIDRDFSPTYYLIIPGHTNPNCSYIKLTYTPIPIEITSFTAFANNGVVEINWSTATETNNKGFEVERESVGNIQYAIGNLKNAEDNWQKIGFVDGYGTTTESHLYKFTDNNITSGKYMYRLKQIDFDGKSKYSKEVEVDVNMPMVYSLSQNFPNPFNPATNINYQIPINNFVSLKIYNTLGEEVATLVSEQQTAGNYEVKFDGSSLSSGVYLYRLTSGNFSETKKFTLIK